MEMAGVGLVQEKRKCRNRECKATKAVAEGIVSANVNFKACNGCMDGWDDDKL